MPTARSSVPPMQQAILFPFLAIMASFQANMFPALAQNCQLPTVKMVSSTVATVIDFQTIKLENGDIARLAGLYFPFQDRGIPKHSARFSAGRQKAEPAPGQVRSLLEHFLSGQTLSYKKAGSRNRYDHVVRQLYLADNTVTTIQEHLISRGYALFHARQQPVNCARSQLAAEARAMATRQGIWQYKNDIVLPAIPAKNLDWKTQAFHIIEGKIHAIGQTRHMVYLNFEANWRKDFTITIDRKQLASLEKAGISLTLLEGKSVRIRGWMEFRNGPMIPLTLTDNLEIIE